MINGTGPYALIVDTGAEVTVLGGRVRQQLEKDIERVDGEAVGPSGGREQVQSVLKMKSLVVGGVQLSAKSGIVMDVDQMLNRVGIEADGLLGFDAFAEKLLTIDFPGSQIRLSSGVLPPVDDARVFRLASGSVARMDISIPGFKGIVMLDSGGIGSGFSLPIDDVSVLRSPPVPMGARIDIGKVFVSHGGRIKQAFRFGPSTFEGALVNVSRGTPLVGTGILKHFCLTFDRHSGAVEMIPQFDRNVEQEPWRGIGAGIRPVDGAYEIIAVFAGSPATRAGVLSEDRITAINGKPVSKLRCDAWRELMKSDKVVLTIRRGESDIELSVDVGEQVP